MDYNVILKIKLQLDKAREKERENDKCGVSGGGIQNKITHRWLLQQNICNKTQNQCRKGKFVCVEYK